MSPRRTVPAMLVAAALVAAAACRSPAAGTLSGGAGSLEQLSRRLLQAVSTGDTAAMHALRVTELEHNLILWPLFPASRTEFNMAAEFAWENLDRRSRRDAGRIIHDRGGRAWVFRGVRCREGATRYGPLTVHGDCWITAAGPPGLVTFKVFGSAVELGGRFKAIGILED